MKRTGRSVARDSGLNLAARMTSGAAVLGLAVISTNVLDTHGRGVYAILSTWAGVAMTIITGGTVVLAADLIHGRHRAPVLTAPRVRSRSRPPCSCSRSPTPSRS